MSEESVLSFRKLVSAMRTTEKEYWAHRDKKILRQSIELEKRVDGIIMKAEGKEATARQGAGQLPLQDHQGERSQDR